MMSPGTLFLSLFLITLSWHLGLSMELAIVSFSGMIISVLAGLKLVTVERPTWGLLFVLIATGAFMGNQVLEDWAVEGSWPQNNGLGAGILISLLIYLLWVFASRQSERIELALDRDTQTILVLGLLMLLLMAPPENTIVFVMDERLSLFALFGIVTAFLALLADRLAGQLFTRLLLLLPLLITVPVFNSLLEMGQQPVIAAIGNLMPSPRSFNPTGFSHYQQLNPAAFLRPSSRAVMRIRSEEYPGRYLVGNRLTVLDEELVWRPAGIGENTLTTFDAELTETNEWRYRIENNQFPGAATGRYTIHNLTNDDYVFMSPDTTHISGRFEELSREPAYAFVWTADFERGSDRRWQVESTAASAPGTTEQQHLILPAFWDQQLQQKSEEFQTGSRQETVDNLVNYFTSRQYSLQTNFDPDQPFHDFFLNDQPAYCFWFATAATLALRANDIPSRLVSGYAVNEQISPELWLVRDRDAHSWVEWQDEQGYWHSVDPTPASIESFFGGYQSSTVSRWYHYLAGQWQLLIDWVLADAFVASVVRYGGVLILIFLFVREYRRQRSDRRSMDNRSKRWQKLWQRFVQKANLPIQPAWTVSAYAENLPPEWPEERRVAVRAFLADYNQNRFSQQDEESLSKVEKSLEICLKSLATIPSKPA